MLIFGPNGESKPRLHFWSCLTCIRFPILLFRTCRRFWWYSFSDNTFSPGAVLVKALSCHHTLQGSQWVWENPYIFRETHFSREGPRDWVRYGFTENSLSTIKITDRTMAIYGNGNDFGVDNKILERAMRKEMDRTSLKLCNKDIKLKRLPVHLQETTRPNMTGLLYWICFTRPPHLNECQCTVVKDEQAHIWLYVKGKKPLSSLIRLMLDLHLWHFFQVCDTTLYLPPDVRRITSSHYS